ncbi:MAG: ferredoxin [Frankiales bacterium]|nr:ferredoxin [Frankiales bacterium]
MGLLDTLVRRGSALTTPFLPDDYLSMVNPLWSGGRGPTRELRARVEAVSREAAGSATLVLKPGLGWDGHLPGQYVGVGVEIGGVRHWRTYSLTSPDRVTITVKGLGLVSNQLVRRTPVGTVLRLRPAAGDFVWRSGRPALFLTAGSGVTPAMGMLRGLVRRGPLPDITHLHSALARDEVIFGPELRRLHATYPPYRLVERHTAADGLLTMSELDALVPDWRERETWVCGPAGLLEAVSDHWTSAGLSERLHVERFTPLVVGGGSGLVSFARTGAQAQADSTLLEAGESAGVLMPSGCRMGICFGCVVPLLQGQVRDVRTGDVHGEPGDLVQTCISSPEGDCALDV